MKIAIFSFSVNFGFLNLAVCIAYLACNVESSLLHVLFILLFIYLFVCLFVYLFIHLFILFSLFFATLFISEQFAGVRKEGFSVLTHICKNAIQSSIVFCGDWQRWGTTHASGWIFSSKSCITDNFFHQSPLLPLLIQPQKWSANMTSHAKTFLTVSVRTTERTASERIIWITIVNSLVPRYLRASCFYMCW